MTAYDGRKHLADLQAAAKADTAARAVKRAEAVAASGLPSRKALSAEIAAITAEGTAQAAALKAMELATAALKAELAHAVERRRLARTARRTSAVDIEAADEAIQTLLDRLAALAPSS